MAEDLRVPGILTCPPERLSDSGLWYLSDYTWDMENSPFFRCPFVWYWIQINDFSKKRGMIAYGATTTKPIRA